MKKSILLITIFVFGLITQLQAQTVYVTSAGDKYHKKDCQYAKSGDIKSMSMDEAKGKGLTPCSVCFNETPAKAAVETKTTAIKEASKSKAEIQKEAEKTKMAEKKEADKVKADAKREADKAKIAQKKEAEKVKKEAEKAKIAAKEVLIERTRVWLTLRLTVFSKSS